MTRDIGQLAYLVATVLFIFALHWMNDPKTARHGVYAGVGAMALAIGATWIQPQIVHHDWIVLAIIAGFVVGVPLSRVPLTAVPQRTALSHAFGGAAAGLVGTAKYFLWFGNEPEHAELPVPSDIRIVKRGAEGATIGGQDYPPVPGDVVDTTGAGDAFHGGLLYGFLKGEDLETSLTFANAVAAMKCSALGARTALPSSSELKNFLNNPC